MIDEGKIKEAVKMIIEAEHMCMTMRGVKKPGTKTTTMVSKGIFSEDREMQNQVISLIRLN